MTKRLLFFATKKDLIRLLESVENEAAIDYIPMGQRDTRVAKRYSSSGEIPNLGQATSDSAISSQEFLVVPRSSPINERGIAQNDGTVRYAFDQLANPCSITFAPGGFRGDDILVHGRVATVSDHEVSKALMRRFAKEVRKSFNKVRAFWVGQEAEKLLDAGARLTASVRASRALDLSRA